MHINEPHHWDCTTEEARTIQNNLATAIRLVDKISLSDVHFIAGVDNAYARKGNQVWGFGVVVILHFPGMDLVETKNASLPVTFPYVPGLLSFREAPAILAAYKKITTEPDLVFFDGQGFAHPRRIGLASHLGLFIHKPSIGIAKRKLIGNYEEPGSMKGDYAPLVDNISGELLGYVLRTRLMRKPVFVSPGHLISFQTALQAAILCLRENHVLPEPVRQAHQIVTKLARSNTEINGA